MFMSLGMIYFGSLPPSRQQIVEKAVDCWEIVTDLMNASYPEDKLDVVEHLFKRFAMDFAVDTNKLLAELAEYALFYISAKPKLLSSLIARFALAAQPISTWQIVTKSK